MKHATLPVIYFSARMKANSSSPSEDTSRSYADEGERLLSEHQHEQHPLLSMDAEFGTGNVRNSKALKATETRKISRAESVTEDAVLTPSVKYRTYKRRWFGLAQLILLNAVISWDVRLLDSIKLSPKLIMAN